MHPPLWLGRQTYDGFVLSSPGLRGYWPLGDRSGTTARDELGRNNGTYVNTPTLGTAGFLGNDLGTAVTFASASTQAVTMASLPTSNVDNWTILAWVKPTAASGSLRLVCYNGTSPTNGFGLYLNGSNQVYAYAESVGELVTGSGPAVVTTSGTFIALVRRAGTTFSYINGALNETGNTSTPITPTGVASIGREGAASFSFDGVIQRVAILARPLSPAEITNLYALGQGK